MDDIELLVVLEIPETKPVICQFEGCGRSVYRRVHVVRQSGQLRIYGSECAKKVLGLARAASKSSAIKVYSANLSERDVDLLKQNTEALLEELRHRFSKVEPTKPSQSPSKLSRSEVEPAEPSQSPSKLNRSELEQYCINTIKEQFRREKEKGDATLLKADG